MAAKLSTAMQTAILVARINGEVRPGDSQRTAQLGMAGKISSATLEALGARSLLGRTLNGAAWELTRKGYRALCEHGLISVEAYQIELHDWKEWMDVMHAEALEMDADLMAQAEAEEGYEREVLGSFGEDAKQLSQPRPLFVRHTRRGSERVVVERVHAGRVAYRVLDTTSGRVSAPYRMREKTFFDSYAPSAS